MKTKSILNFRNAYDGIFSSIRRTHMKKLFEMYYTINFSILWFVSRYVFV